MIQARGVAAGLVLLLGLVGCASAEPEASAADELTWQEAKARTQAMELEIADSIPRDEVADVAQMPTGMLIDCGGSTVNWNGVTTVPLTAGAEPDPGVRAPEEK